MLTSHKFVEACKQADREGVHNAMILLASGKKQSKNILLKNNSDPIESSSQQLAADQIVHLIQGWVNFSTALSSLLFKANAQAIHMAYYAELRAALSLFSYSGIAVKNGKGFYLDLDGNRQNLPINNTHQDVWELWKQWTQEKFATDLLLDGIKFSPDITLRSLKDQIPNVSISPNVITSWGYDLLQNGSEDKNLRNRASYGTSLICSQDIKKISSVKCKFFFDVWDSILQFSNTTLNFDIYLVKELLIKIYSGNLHKFSDDIDKIYSSSCPPSIRAIQTCERNSIFSHAEKHTQKPECILSRALIMLRYATLALERNLKYADNPKQWIRTWLQLSEIPFNLKEDAIDCCQTAKEELLNSCPMNKSLKIMLKEELQSSVMKLSRPSVCLWWGLPL